MVAPSHFGGSFGSHFSPAAGADDTHDPSAVGPAFPLQVSPEAPQSIRTSCPCSQPMATFPSQRVPLWGERPARNPRLVTVIAPR